MLQALGRARVGARVGVSPSRPAHHHHDDDDAAAAAAAAPNDRNDATDSDVSMMLRELPDDVKEEAASVIESWIALSGDDSSDTLSSQAAAAGSSEEGGGDVMMQELEAIWGMRIVSGGDGGGDNAVLLSNPDTYTRTEMARFSLQLLLEVWAGRVLPVHIANTMADIRMRLR